MNDTTFQGDGKVAYVPVVVNAKPKPITNADAVRAMSDEELAEWLDNIDTAYEPETVVSRHGWLSWLRQEVIK